MFLARQLWRYLGGFERRKYFSGKRIRFEVIYPADRFKKQLRYSGRRFFATTTVHFVPPSQSESFKRKVRPVAERGFILRPEGSERVRRVLLHPETVVARGVIPSYPVVPPSRKKEWIGTPEGWVNKRTGEFRLPYGGLSFADVRKAKICYQRNVRKRVLHALDLVGKLNYNRVKKTINSAIRC